MTAAAAQLVDVAPPGDVSVSRRILTIDVTRGAVMILMALDHVRYFFTNVPFAPEDIERTSLALFLTRWVTHFCAPLFFFLSGTSAMLSGRLRNAAELSRYLLLRGALLVLLELTVIGFGWNFDPGYSFAGVIWALGWSMITLAAMLRLPLPVITSLAVVVIAGHDLLHRFAPATRVANTLWRFLHVPGNVDVLGASYFVLYPLIPWCGVMWLGYATGVMWQRAAAERQAILLTAGVAGTILFILLRVSNAYGNPVGTGSGKAPFTIFESMEKTFISLLNVAKYPPSLQYLLMTLGLAALGMGFAERWYRRHEAGLIARVLGTFGRVPMFYYVLHLYLIHLLALVVAQVSGQPSQWLGWKGDQSNVPPPGYGYGLVVVYGVTLVVVLLLYPACRWYERAKRERRAAWMRYV